MTASTATAPPVRDNGSTAAPVWGRSPTGLHVLLGTRVRSVACGAGVSRVQCAARGIRAGENRRLAVAGGEPAAPHEAAAVASAIGGLPRAAAAGRDRNANTRGAARAIARVGASVIRAAVTVARATLPPSVGRCARGPNVRACGRVPAPAAATRAHASGTRAAAADIDLAAGRQGLRGRSAPSYHQGQHDQRRLRGPVTARACEGAPGVGESLHFGLESTARASRLAHAHAARGLFEWARSCRSPIAASLPRSSRCRALSPFEHAANLRGKERLALAADVAPGRKLSRHGAERAPLGRQDAGAGNRSLLSLDGEEGAAVHEGSWCPPSRLGLSHPVSTHPDLSSTPCLGRYRSSSCSRCTPHRHCRSIGRRIRSGTCRTCRSSHPRTSAGRTADRRRAECTSQS
jgi:hypothetical protein